MRAENADISGITKIVPARFCDKRGYFSEIFKLDWFREHVADVTFVQENESLSSLAGTIRGLHFQTAPFAQGKLIRCCRGSIFDVAVDIRHGSQTFGQFLTVTLTADAGEQLWIPAGFAHGFMTLVPDTVVQYKVTAPYSGNHDRGIRWNDPAIGIEWPEAESYLLSAKDENQPLLSDLPEYFHYNDGG